MKIGYGKLGRSMPLTLAGCGTVGGDIEGIAVLVEMAKRWPEHEFFIIGRNSGEEPTSVGLPRNIVNPWREWTPAEKKWARETDFSPIGGMSLEEKMRLVDFYRQEIVPFIGNLDGIVMWEGQHGTSNAPVPMTDDKNQLTGPLDSQVRYCSFMLLGINAFRDRDPLKYEEIVLNADARNVRQSRDQRWPSRHPVLAQYNTSKNVHHHRAQGSRIPTAEELVIPPEFKGMVMPNGHLWSSKVRYCYSRVEINALAPGTEYSSMITFNDQWEGRKHFGLFINEARAYVNPKLQRKHALKHYVLPLMPAFIHGKWSDKSQQELGVSISPAPWEQYFPLLQSVRSTFTSPSSGSGWATTKPWEAFAAGTVCFFHPDYDSQDHILKDAPEELRAYLRPPTISGFHNRVREMNEDKDKWFHMVQMQRAHFDKAIHDLQYMRMIEDRLALSAPSVEPTTAETF